MAGPFLLLKGFAALVQLFVSLRHTNDPIPPLGHSLKGVSKYASKFAARNFDTYKNDVRSYEPSLEFLHTWLHRTSPYLSTLQNGVQLRDVLFNSVTEYPGFFQRYLSGAQPAMSRLFSLTDGSMRAYSTGEFLTEAAYAVGKRTLPVMVPILQFIQFCVHMVQGLL